MSIQTSNSSGSAAGSAPYCQGKVDDVQDCFSCFGLPRKLKLDLAQLEREFHQLSRKLHPDLFTRSSAEEQDWSMEQSSQLNDAYRTLKDPIRRTQYMLRLEGIELEEQSQAATEQARASGQAKKQFVPADLLEEVFELNMQLDDLRTNKKNGDSDPALIQELESQKVSLDKKQEALLHELKSYWDEWDALSDDSPQESRNQVSAKMADLLNRRSYIRNLVRDVTAALEN